MQNPWVVLQHDVDTFGYWNGGGGNISEYTVLAETFNTQDGAAWWAAILNEHDGRDITPEVDFPGDPIRVRRFFSAISRDALDKLENEEAAGREADLAPYGGAWQREQEDRRYGSWRS